MNPENGHAWAGHARAPHLLGTWLLDDSGDADSARTELGKRLLAIDRALAIEPRTPVFLIERARLLLLSGRLGDRAAADRAAGGRRAASR